MAQSRDVDAEWLLFVDADVLPTEQFLKELPAMLKTAAVDGLGFHVREHFRASDWDFYRALERDPPRMQWPSRVGQRSALRLPNRSAPCGWRIRSRFSHKRRRHDLGYRLTLAGESLAHVPKICGEHYRKDSLRSFLQMHRRYAVTAKRVDRSHYFPTQDAARLPLFKWRSAWSLLRLMLRFLRKRPNALPPAVNPRGNHLRCT